MMSPYKERRNTSFSSDCEDGMEESSVLSSLSPPRSCRKAGSSFGLDSAFHPCDTPKTRRLFDECEEDTDDYAKHSPCQPSSNRHGNISDNFIAFPVESALPQSRKRSSHNSSSTRTSNQYNKTHMDTSGSDESDVTMYASPKLSPNSFMTMDGRFVHSKNPFSSPMMDDTPVSQLNNGINLSSSTKAAPSLPVSFFSSSLESNMPSLLPPRSSNRLLPSAASSILTKSSTLASDNQNGDTNFGLNDGYPDKRFSFTGSPILETANDVISTDAGIYSSASIRKVRKLNLCDDVVSATSHDMYLRQARTKTSLEYVGNDFGDWILEEQGVSPTDVQDFPPPTRTKSNAPPPTPVKSRPTHDPYNSSRRRNFGTPGPPLLERRRQGPSRTPYAGLQGIADDDLSDGDCVQSTKSRFYSDFDVIGELGEGSFGKVYKVLSRLDGCMYAIKAAHRQAKGASDRDRMLKEVYALAALSDLADTANFHIVRFHQAWMEDDRLFIQTELCIGTLSEEIARGDLADENRRYKLLREMLLALDLIHRNNMVHLDIKPDNVFVKNDQYKLGDFGLVTKLSANQDVEEGDSRYMSMELLLGDKNDLRKSDIFSLGATLYEICLGRSLPMNGQEWRDIRAGNICSLLKTGDDLVTIIRQMIDPIPGSRPTPSELLQHRQLLSEEQKALKAAKTKVVHANMQLAAQEQRFQRLGPAFIQRKGLTRANTWNGTTFPY